MPDVKKTLKEAVDKMTQIRKAAEQAAEKERQEREKAKATPKAG